MPSVTDVVNTALRLIAAESITSLTDGSVSANVANDLYSEVRDDLLRTHPWNFATKRQKLAQSSTAPVYEFDHAYPVPSDWLRTIAVHGNDEGAGIIVYKEAQVGSQRVIEAGVDELWITYVARVTDPNLMPADFRRALAECLARDLAAPLAQSNTLAERYRKQAERTLARARSADAMGGFPDQRPRGSWAQSRRAPWPRVGIEGD